MGSNPSIKRQRLDSWKEIAVFFGRDERTVNRWEKELGLPIHRLPGTKGRVYAYTDELSSWLATSRKAGAASRAQSGGPESEIPSARLSVVPPASLPGSAAAAPPASQPTPVATEMSAPPRQRSGWIVAGALTLMAVLSLILLRQPRLVTGEQAGARMVPQGRAVVQASSHAHNPDAEQLYLQGRYYWNKRTPDDLNKAVDYFVQAIVRDPNYAPAYIGLADCYNLLREYTAMSAAEAYPRAYAAAKKAVELDDQSSAAHASLAFVLFYGRWEVAAAEQEFRRAIDLDPNNAEAHHWHATYLLTLRRMPESLVEIERAQMLDPTSAPILADKGDILFQSGRRDEAMSLLKQMEVTEPSFRSPHFYLKSFYLAEGDYPNFLVEAKKDAVLVHDEAATAVASAAEKGFAAGGAKGMLASMLQTEKKYYAQGLISPVLVAETCALLGDKAAALQYLNIAYTRHDELLLSIQNFFGLRSLRDDPAYRSLLEKMNLPVEN